MQLNRDTINIIAFNYYPSRHKFLCVFLHTSSDKDDKIECIDINNGDRDRIDELIDNVKNKTTQSISTNLYTINRIYNLESLNYGRN